MVLIPGPRKAPREGAGSEGTASPRAGQRRPRLCDVPFAYLFLSSVAV